MIVLRLSFTADMTGDTSVVPQTSPGDGPIRVQAACLPRLSDSRRPAGLSLNSHGTKRSEKIGFLC